MIRLAGGLTLCVLIGCADADRVDPAADDSTATLATADAAPPAERADPPTEPAAPVRSAAGDPPGPDEVAALAPVGARLFREIGCTECHTTGAGDRRGPDLADLHDRAGYAWATAMMLRPDSMLQADADARMLYMLHFEAMPDLGLEPAQARAIWAYLADAR